MLKIKNLIFILLLIQSGFCLKKNDLCIKSNQTFSMTCGGKYSYACKYNMCAVDREACDQYTGLVFTVKSLGNYSLLMIRFQDFLSKISNCPIITSSEKHYVNVCSNKSKGCSLSFLGIKANLMRNKNCGCTGSLSYTCDRNICALSKKECDSYKSQVMKQPPNKSLKMCLNG